MIRYSSNDIIEVGRLTSGTSAQFIGINCKTGKKGIYKQNGCVLGIDNDDIREKLSSDILSSLGIENASIDLVYEEETKQNSYFSNYIIGENEELVTPNTMGCKSELQNPIENMCERYVQGVKNFTNDERLIEDSKKNFYRYTYMCCMLDCYDIKADNLPLVYNKDTDRYSVAPWFDFGTAFCPEHKSAPIYNMSTDEMLETLFENHYEDIKDIAIKVNCSLTPEKINEIFNSDYILETLGEKDIEEIKARFMSQVEKSRELEISKEKNSKEDTKGIKAFFTSLKNRLFSILNRSKNVKLLDGSRNENKEKLANVGDTSVTEMNEDSHDAKLLKLLQNKIYLPEEATTGYKENNNIDEENIMIDNKGDINVCRLHKNKS